MTDRRLALPATAFAIVLAVALAWRPMVALDLHGWDTYPMILAARAQTPFELLATLGEELMQGRFPGGRYYRPLVHLSFALDHALWGLEPRGYHLTDVAILAAGALAVAALARRLVGGALAPLVAGLVYALHPIHFELLPLPARRADALAALFVVLTLVVQAGERRRPLLVGLTALCAMGSKETGVIAPLLALALACAELEGGVLARLAGAARATAPALVALALYALVRTTVLGGLGGGPRSSALGALLESDATAERYSILMAYPLPWMGDGGAFWFALGAVVCVATLLALGRPARGRPTGLLLLLWIALAVLVTGLSGVLRSWYALAFLPPVALALGTLAERGRAAWRGGSRPRAAAALATLAGVLLLQLGGLVRMDAAGEKRAASLAARELVERFRAEVERAEPGTTLVIDARPPPGSALRHGRDTSRPMVLAPYSLEAWAALALPDVRVRVDVRREELLQRAEPGEILVLLVARS